MGNRGARTLDVPVDIRGNSRGDYWEDEPRCEGIAVTRWDGQRAPRCRGCDGERCLYAGHSDHCAATCPLRRPAAAVLDASARFDAWEPPPELYRMGARYYVPDISLSGCGMHVFFHMGVTNYLLEQGIYVQRLHCSSGGALAALYYLLDWRKRAPLDKMLSLLPRGALQANAGYVEWLRHTAAHCCSCRPEQRRRPNEGPSRLGSGTRLYAVDPATYRGAPGHLNRGVELARQRLLIWIRQLVLEDPDAYKKVSGRLVVYVKPRSYLFRPTQRFSHFTSNEDLLNAISCTTDEPFLSGTQGFQGHWWRGERWFDGGAEDLHPVENGHTLCVTTYPFSARPWSMAHFVKGGQLPEIYGEVDARGAWQVLSDQHYRNLWHLGRHKARCFFAQMDWNGNYWHGQKLRDPGPPTAPGPGCPIPRWHHPMAYRSQTY